MNNRNALKLAEDIKNKVIDIEKLSNEVLENLKNDKLGSIVSINYSCLDERKESDSILNGVPILLKDNILCYGKKTSAASKMLDNFIAPYSATVVKKIIDSGMMIVGNTNMDEFAMGSSNETSYKGIVKNYWDNERIPGGSSGGSATAVASGLVPFALGTDTGGSIRQPACLSGIIGIKPTYGRVSRYGLIAFGSSLDQIGVFSNNVKDGASLLGVIAGYDENDATSMDIEVPNYLENIDKDIKGIRIGLPKEYFSKELDKDIKASIDKAIEKLKEKGAIFKEVSIPHSKYGVAAYYIISSAEAASNLARFDGIRYGYRAENSETIEDVYVKSRTNGFGREVKRRIMIGNYVLSSGFYDAYYKKASQIRRLLKEDFKKVFEEVDIILSPTSPSLAFKIGERMNDPIQMYLADIYTVSINLVGLPAISIPTSLINGLPTGMQLIGNYFEEEKILNVANIYEKLRGDLVE